MDIPTPAELRAISEQTRENNIRNRIANALTAASSGSALSMTVNADYSATIDAALVARGYTTVSHDGSNWSIGWAGAADVAEDASSPYKKAVFLLATTSKTGEMYFCDTVREALHAAAANNETSVVVDCEYMPSMQTQLETMGFTVSHSDGAWTIEW